MTDSLDTSSLEKALAALKQGLLDEEAQPNLRTLKDGVVQQFEFTVDLSWKLLQKYLQQIAQVDPASLRTKKDIFRESASRKLIADAERWIGHYDARNETSHTYDIDRATAVFERAKLLPPDVEYLINALRTAS